MNRIRKNQGFTLVEILIVVVILGILAAIVIPQFTSASVAAQASSLTSQLQTVRSQLELYQIEHNGEYPDLSTDWDQLTGTTDIDGVTTGTDFGPYLQKGAINPFATSATNDVVNQVTGVATAVTGTGGTHAWAYNQDTGEIKALLRNDLALETNLVETGHAAGADHPDFITYTP